MYHEIEKRKKREEQKVSALAKTEAKNVEVTNLYDVMMANMGIDTSKIKK